MPKQRKNVLFSFIAASAILLSACGTANSTPDPTISTAVAQTVAAQNIDQEVTATRASTQTPVPGVTLTPLATRVPPTLPASSGYASCLKANYVGQTIPDGTIMKPGEYFTQTWKIKNSSNCTWDTSYKIVFWDGDVMGGAYVYNFPQSVTPDQVMDVPLQLVAPTENGTYESHWMLQAPDGSNFGVGEYSQPFYTEIAVSDDERPDYGVLSVEYEIVREPLTGCPRNIFYTVYAKITVSGPVEISYYWAQSDGNDSNIRTLEFSDAGSQTISRDWTVGITDSHNDRWMQIIVTDPVQVEYGKAIWSFPCD